MDKRIYREYVAILKEELQPAMGCTEPIAVAYCAALARQTLGALPETVEVRTSSKMSRASSFRIRTACAASRPRPRLASWPTTRMRSFRCSQSSRRSR